MSRPEALIGLFALMAMPIRLRAEPYTPVLGDQKLAAVARTPTRCWNEPQRAAQVRARCPSTLCPSIVESGIRGLSFFCLGIEAVADPTGP